MNQEYIMRRSLFVNFFLVVIKILSGILFRSTSLIADGIHSISDLLSDILVILGMKQSRVPADEVHPLGHGKFEYILSLFLGISVSIIAYTLGKSIILNWDNEVLLPNPISLIVVIFVIIVKLILARYLIRKGKIIKSEVVLASGKESFSDVLSSSVVFVGIIGMIIGKQFDIGFLIYSDKIASFVVTILIVKVAIEIIVDAIRSIMGKQVDQEVYQQYFDEIVYVDGVEGINRLIIINYGPFYQVLVDISVNGNLTVKEGHDIAFAVSSMLNNDEKICNVTVHIDPKE